MHPAGCFGSVLAFDEKSKACGGCSGRAECMAEVKSRRLPFLRQLSNFSDGQGDTMALRWLTPEERRILRERREGVANKIRRQSELDVIIAAVNARPLTMSELVVEVAQKCSLSASTARRKTYEAVKTLRAQNRLKSNSQLIEIA